MPRASLPHEFEQKMSEIFGGHKTSTLERATREHASIHSEAWSLMESGESRKAGALMHAHKSGDLERVELIRKSTANVKYVDHLQKHKELQHTLLLEEMNEAVRMGSKTHAFALKTTNRAPEQPESTFVCKYACAECGIELDMKDNGPCRTFGCKSDQVGFYYIFRYLMNTNCYRHMNSPFFFFIFLFIFCSFLFSLRLLHLFFKV